MTNPIALPPSFCAAPVKVGGGAEVVNCGNVEVVLEPIGALSSVLRVVSSLVVGVGVSDVLVSRVLVSMMTLEDGREFGVGVTTVVLRLGDEVEATNVEVTISSVVGDGVDATTISEVCAALVGACDVTVRGGAWLWMTVDPAPVVSET